MRNQIVYACSNPKFMAEMNRSASSFRSYTMGAILRAYVTLETAPLVAEGLFDTVQQIEPRFHERPRFESMLQADDGPALFLDCDTLAIGPTGSSNH